MSGEIRSADQNTAHIEPVAGISRFVVAYKRDSRPWLNILLLGMVALVGSLWMFTLVEFGTNPTPLHFTENENGQIIEPVPLDQPGITKPVLLNWVNDFVSQAFNFNYSNVYKQQSKVYDYLSDAAMSQYLDLLQKDQDFGIIVPYRFVVSVTPLEAPEIITDKAFRGRYAWQIRLKVQIIFSNAARKTSQNNTFDFVVWRVPETENPLGITIASFTRKVTGRTGMQGVGRVM